MILETKMVVDMREHEGRIETGVPFVNTPRGFGGWIAVQAYASDLLKEVARVLIECNREDLQEQRSALAELSLLMAKAVEHLDRALSNDTEFDPKLLGLLLGQIADRARAHRFALAVEEGNHERS